MKDIIAGAVELQSFCEARGWRFCFIGGLAVQRWSEPRFTHDADLTLLSGFGSEEGFIDPLLANFAARFTGEREFALQHRALRLVASNDVPLAIALDALPFEEHTVQRSSRWHLPGYPTGLVTCSADDLIVHKAFAARPRDWLDLESIVLRQRRKLNVEQIWTELRPLVALKEERKS